MDQRLEQVLIEQCTTSTPQVIFSALDPQTIVEESYAVGNAQSGQRPSTRQTITSTIQLPLFPDLVRGVCHRLWDNEVKWGSGNAFSMFDEKDIEELSGNLVVQRAIERLVPLSQSQKEGVPFLIDAYCTDGCSVEERRSLGLSRALDRQDQLDLMIVLLRETQSPRRLRLMDGERAFRALPRLTIQIDAMEHLAFCAPQDVAPLVSALCYLLDAFEEGFTLWLNIDDDDPAFPQQVREALGPHFMVRVTHDLTL